MKLLNRLFKEQKMINLLEEEEIWELLETSLKTFVKNYYRNTPKEELIEIKLEKDKKDLDLVVEKTAKVKIEDENKEVDIDKARKIDEDIEVGDKIKISEFRNKSEKEKFIKKIFKDLEELINSKKAEMIKSSGATGSQGQKVAGEIVAKEDEGWIIEVDKNKFNHVKRIEDEIDIEYRGFRGLLGNKQIPKAISYKSGNKLDCYYSDFEIDEEFNYNFGFKPNFSINSDEFLRSLLRQYVPKVAQGHISIRRMQRYPPHLAKVAVAGDGLKKEEDPVKIVVGDRAKNIRKISNNMNGELISIIQFSTDFKEFVKNSLVDEKGQKVSFDKVKIINNNISFEDIEYNNNKKEFMIDGDKPLNKLEIEVYITKIEENERKTYRETQRMVGQEGKNVNVTSNLLGVNRLNIINPYKN